MLCVGRCQKFAMSDCRNVSPITGKDMRRLVIIPLLTCLVSVPLAGVFAQEVPPPKSDEDNGYSQIAIFAKALGIASAGLRG